jgi:hypothetical protein
MLRTRALLAVGVAALSMCAHATDYTDIWWAGKAEDGWGVNLAHSDKFIFATFFVYGPGNVPTWYAGNLTLDPTGAFTGGLYATTGTYLGTVPYNPAQYSATQVGNASFRPSAPDAGVLTYNVGAVSATKNIQRQTLTAVSLAGAYTGGVAVLDTACPNPADNGPTDVPANIVVTQSGGGQVTLALDVMGLATCSVTSTAPAVQVGQLYSFAGRMVCAGLGITANQAVAASELRVTSLGIEGRFVASEPGECREDIRIGGVRKF